jgi:hypothetical protein
MAIEKGRGLARLTQHGTGDRGPRRNDPSASGVYRCTMRGVVLLVLALGALFARPLAAQQSLARRPVIAPTGVSGRSAGAVQVPELPQSQPPASVGKLAAAGFFGAAVGFFGGLLAGSRVENEWFPCNCDDPGLAGALFGAILAPAVTTPVAVHLANRSRGSLASGFGWAALVSGASVLGMVAGLQSEAGLMFLVASPIAQIFVAVANERATSANRSER